MSSGPFLFGVGARVNNAGAAAIRGELRGSMGVELFSGETVGLAVSSSVSYSSLNASNFFGSKTTLSRVTCRVLEVSILRNFYSPKRKRLSVYFETVFWDGKFQTLQNNTEKSS